MGKIVEIDTCWLCPEYEYYNAQQRCGKKHKYLHGQEEGQPIPKWCPLLDAEAERPDCDFCGVSVYPYCSRCGKLRTT